MVAVGFAAKELIRWNEDGVTRTSSIPRRSRSPCSRCSLLLTGASDITWGHEIATTQFYPPHMYLLLFLVGLPGQFLFGVTTMTMSAVVTTYVFGVVYFAATGIYFFYDSYIPIAVFLGMHLLFTDPSTSPRTELGRIIFGVLYGLSTVALYSVLLRAGMPTFYDKLLQVPLLNLSARLLDRLARSPLLQRFDPAAWGRALVPRRRHLAYISVWAVVFVAMSASGLGDNHPGQWLPFWQQACAADARSACEDLYFLQDGYCEDGSGWACNELGILLTEHYANRAPGGGGVRARVQAGVLRRLRQHRRHDAGRHVPPRRADGGRLPVHPARQQGADPGSRARAALRARLRAGLARHLRDSIAALRSALPANESTRSSV